MTNEELAAQVEVLREALEGAFQLMDENSKKRYTTAVENFTWLLVPTEITRMAEAAKEGE